MRPATLQPEPLDLAIFQEMSGGWAISLPGIDPRLNPTRIARRLRVGRARVARRLKAWSDAGFLLRYDVWLNPALFGAVGAFYSVRVDRPGAKLGLLSRFGLLDGAVSGMEFLGEWVTFSGVVSDASEFERVRELLRGFEGVREVTPPDPWPVVEPRRKLTPLDVRILRALRRAPRATLGTIAARAGISARTMTRRYGELIDDHAAWFVPVFDFRAVSSPLVSLLVTLAPGRSPTALLQGIRARYPLVLEFAGSDSGDAAGPTPRAFIVLPPSAAHLEELDRHVAGLDGVVAEESNVMVRMHTFPAWFDRRLAEAAAPRP